MSDATTDRDRGNALYLQGRYAEAADCYRAALRLRPDDFDACNNLGAALADLGRPEEAVACYRDALRLRPGFPEAHYNLGNVLRRGGRLEPALACYAEALRLRPDFAEGHNNLGITLRKLGRPAEAITSLRHSLSLRPDNPPALVNLGLALADSGRIAEALACYDEAIRLDPENADAHHDRALARLLLGDWTRGWPEYEWRWRCEEFGPGLVPDPPPRWDGGPLDGRTLLLYAEQGSGDILQFVRYASPVKRRGATVLLAAPRRLHGLLRGVEGVDALVATGAPPDRIDLSCPLLSLPSRFGTTPDTVPADVPYLHADPNRVTRWHAELVREPAGGGEPFARPRLCVGIAWRGSPGMMPYDRRRSIPLPEFDPLARVPGVRLVSLQDGPPEWPAGADPTFPLLDLSERLDESRDAFLDTAAIIANLDLVVACDTAIAHLAGALGVPTWVALPSTPDWRWLFDRDDTPWYPNLRLFRQIRSGCWDDPFRRMAALLRDPRVIGGGDPWHPRGGDAARAHPPADLDR